MKTADPQAITAQQFRRMENFIKSLLNPEELGLAVPAHVRDLARESLGQRRVETQATSSCLYPGLHHCDCECRGEEE